MKIELIGIGGAGCRIAQTISATAPQDSFVGDTFAFDTDPESLRDLSPHPRMTRHQYGGTATGGLHGDLQAGFEVGGRHVDELSHQLDDGRPTVADAFLVIVGLGGATGGGTVPAVVKNLQRLYEKPVYVLATLPAKRELSPTDNTENDHVSEPPTNKAATADSTSRPLAEKNTARTLEQLDGHADAIICFDNERWLQSTDTIPDAYTRLNQTLSTRILALFGAGDTAPDQSAETVIDASDIHRILGKTTGIATLGYGEQAINTASGSRFGLGLFSSDTAVETTTAISAMTTVIQKAIHRTLTLECDRANATEALLIVGGPPAWLNRQAIADGRTELEATIESPMILAGDAPQPDRDTVIAVVLFAGVEPVTRLQELQASTDR
ncbi:tubulin/FtsZ family protein [Natrinema sp. H-ect4]|uniref:tubulin/FtsZ family protein n=1 Tax=Natrinema sp. H-ect4 TaxID=3242699 RepID=UPI0035A86185